jgi:hypothetical protein
MTCWYRQSTPDSKWAKGDLQTEEAGYRSWFISNEKGKEVVRLTNVTLRSVTRC